MNNNSCKIWRKLTLCWLFPLKHALATSDGDDQYLKIKFRNDSTLQGVPKVFRHLKWAVCGELVHLKIFLRKYQMKKKVLFPHYLKILIKLSKHGLSNSFKRNPWSISKITFFANLRVTDTELWYFFNENAVCQQYLSYLNEFSWMDLLNNLLILQR